MKRIEIDSLSELERVAEESVQSTDDEDIPAMAVVE